MLLVTPERTNIARVEKDISPPLALAVTIPLAIDGRRAIFDGFVVYVGLSGFHVPARDSRDVLAAIAAAVVDALDGMPPVNL